MNTIVSVVIPVYNAEKALVKCVESLVYGIEKQIEIILVDDCSIDDSWNLCLQLSRQYHNVYAYQNKSNSGVSYTRNEGIRRAAGKYVVFVDSDDWVSKKYIQELLDGIQRNKGAMVVCGFYYVNLFTGNKIQYVYEDGKSNLSNVNRNDVVDFLNKNLLQTCWNKIFDLSIIKNNKILFDENLKIGEDFRFVLQYMKYIKEQKIICINQPLYYYVEAQGTSAMGNFGWSPIKYALENLKLMAEVFSIDEKILNELCDNLIYNQIYHVVRTEKKSKREKISRIKELTSSKGAEEKYNQQKKILFKEKFFKRISLVKQTFIRVKKKLMRISNIVIINNAKRKLYNNRCTVISQNCIGGVFYHDMNTKFLSPTINLFFRAEDFVKFVLNIEEYLNLELDMQWEETYPIGVLGDIKIYFMHYTSCSQAKDAWDKRKERINYKNMIVVCTDRDGFDDKIYEQWKMIPYKKVLFTVNEKYKSDSTVVFPEFSKQKYVPDLMENRKFYKEGTFIKSINGADRV